MYYCIIGNESSQDKNIFVKSRANIPNSSLNFNEIDVSNRDGKVYEKKNLNDIQIKVDFNFKTTIDEYNSKLREFKKWINGSLDKKLAFSDDLEYFYIVKKADIETPTRTFKRLCNVSVTFTCEPFIYLLEGTYKRNIAPSIYNDYGESRPIYYISGNGNLNLNVNGNTITIAVEEKCIIDTTEGEVLDKNNNDISCNMKGYYQDLYLIEGNNTFTYTNGFNIEIVPNWRDRA